MLVKSNALFGLACMLAYVVLYVGTNILTKLLAPSLPLIQIALFRYAFAVPAILFVLGVAGRHAFRINSGGVHVTRGILAATGSICGYAALASLPLGDATALFFTAPLLITAGVAILLREQAGAFRGACIASGFFGVWLIAQPHFDSTTGLLAGLANALCAALGVLVVRHYRNTEGALALALTTSMVCVAALAIPAFLDWKSVSPFELPALAALGVMGGTATIMLNVAYQSAPPPLLANIDYLAVPCSVAAGAVIWSESPAFQSAAGCLIIVAAGLLNLGRDRLRRYTDLVLRASKSVDRVKEGGRA